MPEIYPPATDVTVAHHVAVPMRDGVTLYADVYRPVQRRKYPVLVSRHTYSTSGAERLRRAAIMHGRG